MRERWAWSRSKRRRARPTRVRPADRIIETIKYAELVSWIRFLEPDPADWTDTVPDAIRDGLRRYFGISSEALAKCSDDVFFDLVGLVASQKPGPKSETSVPPLRSKATAARIETRTERGADQEKRERYKWQRLHDFLDGLGIGIGVHDLEGANKRYEKRYKLFKEQGSDPDPNDDSGAGTVFAFRSSVQEQYERKRAGLPVEPEIVSRLVPRWTGPDVIPEQ